MLVAVLCGLAVVLVMAMVAWKAVAKKAPPPAARPLAAPAAPAAQAPRARGRQRGAMDRMREGLRRRNQQAAAEAAGGDGSGSDDAASGSGSDDEDGHAGVGMDRREQRRAARREAAEAERAAREAQAHKRSAYDERRAQRDAEREAREAAQEAEIARARAEAAAREDEEASKWMGMISVEAAGEAEASDDGQGVLGQFVEFIKARKAVPLEQLAIEFGLRTVDVIDRIRRLEDMGTLTGVMDERGKYIYISMDEMRAVASYIRTRGRVAIAELAAKSNTFIDLEVKPEEAASSCASAAGPQLSFDAILGEAHA